MEENRTQPVPETPASHFDGTTFQLIGWRLVGILVGLITLGIGAPWAYCMVLRWEAKHTVVEGQRLCFDGKGHQLLGRWLLWGLLTVITLGIYSIFLPVRMEKWRVSHTRFAASGEYREDSASALAIFAGVMGGILALGLLLGGAYAAFAYFKKAEPTVRPARPVETLPVQTEPVQTLPPVEAEPIPEYTAPEGVRLPSPNDDGDYWYVDNRKDGLNLRYGPGTEYDVICNLPHGTEVLVLVWENGWAFTGDGWCAGNYLEINPPKDAAPDPAAGLKGEKPKDKRILGTWLFISDHGTTQYENILFQFRSDGVFAAKCRPATYDPSDDAWYIGSGTNIGWDVIDRPAWYGTYTYDGSVLELHYYRESYCGYSGPTSDPNTTVISGWSKIDETVTIYATPQGDTMYIENPQDIRYYPFDVPLSCGSNAESFFWPLPKAKNVEYDYSKEISKIIN